MSELLDDLRAVRGVIHKHETRGSDARSADGLSCAWHSEHAATFGIYGAIYKAVPDNARRHYVVEALRSQLPTCDIALTPYCDSHGAVPLIDAAGKAAKASAETK